MSVEVRHEQWQFNSPLPPPEVLERYEQIIPGFGERVMTQWESQTNHRQQLEKTVITGQTKLQTRGQVFAAVIGIGGLIAAAVVGVWGSSAAAVAIASVDIGTLAGVFIYGKNRQGEDLAAKNAAVPDPHAEQPKLPPTPPKGRPTPPRKKANRKKRR